nr:calcium-transporting ATPase 10, plasma membrane-type-like [Tanacetum cinerariifolium]
SSPYRRNRNPKDLEAGSGEGEEDYDAYDPFDIVRMKSASVDRLERCTDVFIFNGTQTAEPSSKIAACKAL